MKKLWFLLALLVLAAVPAIAQTSVGFDNYHYRASINCSDCHSMHASAHNNLTDGSAITASVVNGNAINPYYPAPNPGPGRKSLLKADDVCASCHDNQTWAPDVIGDHTNGYIRSAGGTRTGVTGGGHMIGSTVRPPGYNGAAVNNYFAAGSVLECASCHSPHGGASYRNLGPYAMKSTIGFATVGNVLPGVRKDTVFNAASDINVNIAGASRAWGTDPLNTYYARGVVTYSKLAAPVAFNSINSSNRLDHFCGVCHGDFHGGELTATTVANGTDFVRHPTSTVLVSAAAHEGVGLANRWNVGNTAGGITFVGQKVLGNVKVYTADGTSDAFTSSPGCISCHKAHGNNNPFGLVYPGRLVTDTTEEGAGVYRDLCQSCHPMGGY